MRQRKSGAVMEMKWLKTEVQMTAREFMEDLELQYRMQAKREFMAKWQAHEERQFEEYVKANKHAYCIKADWLQNPEMKTHRELQSDHWCLPILFFFSLFLSVIVYSS
jgi:hypothetical protein